MLGLSIENFCARFSDFDDVEKGKISKGVKFSGV
jgi:hypothetical protein